LPCPWDVDTGGIVGFKGGTMGCSQSGGGHFLVIPLGMVIVRVIEKMILENFHKDKVDSARMRWTAMWQWKKKRECL